MKIIENTIPSADRTYPFHQPLEQIAFFDIETTGLSPRTSSIYLIGVMYFETTTHTWHIRQWFADDYRSEPEILKHFLSFLKEYRALYHFNGFTFDIPYVMAKCEKYHILIPEHAMALFNNRAIYSQMIVDQALSIDILKEIRPLKKKLNLQKANQTALENWLGIHRTDRYTGGELIAVFSQYMQNRITQPQKASEQEALLLLHNHDDITGMLEVCRLFAYLDALQPCFPESMIQSGEKNSITYSLSDESISITYPLSSNIPRPVKLTHLFPKKEDDFLLPLPSLSLDKDTATLTLPLFRGTLKYFFQPYKDYFFLPLEDTAIHKSVAQFVEPSCRQKATAATCYTKKTGLFYPALNPKARSDSREMPIFYAGYKQSPAYYELTQEPLSQLHAYLVRELPFF